jgi:glycosyltransferase involved in cell wall biosynthesis
MTMTWTIDHPRSEYDPGPPSTRLEATAVDGTDPTRPLRILVGTDTYPPDINGAAYHTARLVAGLAARGHEVHVLCPSQGRFDATVAHNRVTEHRLMSWHTPLHPSFRVCAPFGLSRVAADAIGQSRPDVIHVQGHFPIGRAVAAVARAVGLPVVATNHFMPDNLVGYIRLPTVFTGRLVRWAWRDATRILDRADVVTAPTDTAVRLLQAHGLSTPAQPVSCGINLNTFRPGDHHRSKTRFGLPHRPRLGFVGRLDTEKHLDEAITALAAVRDHVDAQLVIAGLGTQRTTLQAQATRAGVSEYVHFLGFLPDADLPDLYTAMDVFVMPGRAELQSLATLEALACGTPVVAANAVALPHLVHPGANGYLYPPGDTSMLATCLVTLLTDTRLRARMGPRRAGCRPRPRLHAHGRRPPSTSGTIAAANGHKPRPGWRWSTKYEASPTPTNRPTQSRPTCPSS